MSYQTDTIEAVYDEIRELEAVIMAASSNLKPLGQKEATAGANYDDKKNRYLVEMFAEESEKGTKRTEALRAAMYRMMYSTERLQKQIAAHELKAEQDYIKSLLSVLNAKQSRLRVLENERNINARVQP